MAVSFVEYKNADASGSTSVLTATFVNASQAGDNYVIVGTYVDGASFTSLKTNNNDNAVFQKLNGTTTPILSSVGPNDDFLALINNPTVGSTSVSLTFGSAPSFAEIGVYLVRGGQLVQDTGVLVIAGLTGTGLALSGLTGTLADSNEFVVGYCVETVSVSGVNTAQTGSSGFSYDGTDALGSGFSHQVVSSTSPVQAAFNVTTASNYDCAVATFRLAPTFVMGVTKNFKMSIQP